MPAPFPREARVKTAAAGKIAADIHGHYLWLARWSDEIARQDAEIDIKKLAQLALGPQSHCGHFARLTETLTPDLIGALEHRFRQDGLEWRSRVELTADLANIRESAMTLGNFVTSNMPEARVLSSRVWSTEPGAPLEAEVPNKITRAHPVLPLVEGLRAEFAD